MAKKIIKYTLNPDGSIPSYIVDGGYFPVENQGTEPQNFDLVGIALDSATEDSFESESDLLDYVKLNGFKLIDPISNQEVDISATVNSIWSKLNA